MSVHMKTRTIGESVEINLSVIVPASESRLLEEALSGVLALARHQARPVNDEGEELFAAEEVFPDSHPGSRLRGLRGREGLSQRAMAELLGIRQHHIAEMEKGTRAISAEMAKKIGKTFDISYKVFL